MKAYERDTLQGPADSPPVLCPDCRAQMDVLEGQLFCDFCGGLAYIDDRGKPHIYGYWSEEGVQDEPNYRY